MGQSTPFDLSTNFGRLLRFLVDHEAVFAPRHDYDYSREEYVRTEHDPADPGGTTRYGIDQRSHPHVAVAKLTLIEACEIYRQEFEQLAAKMAWPLSAAFFDIEVLNGRHEAVLLLQRALGVAADGHCGPITLRAAQTVTAGELRTMLDLREQHFRAIAKRRPAMGRFLKGWLNRNDDLREFVQSELLS